MSSDHLPTDLPSPPDFAALEANAVRSADRRGKIMTLIGNMVFNWSNNESIFIYIIMILMKIDQDAAIIVFGTLNTTRARIDLVQRLGKVKIRDQATARELDALVERFLDSTRIRNEFNHCLYTVNDVGDITHTQSMRLQETRTGLRLGTSRQMDDDRIEEMMRAILDMTQLNRDLWDFLPRLRERMG